MSLPANVAASLSSQTKKKKAERRKTMELSNANPNGSKDGAYDTIVMRLRIICRLLARKFLRSINKFASL